LNILTKILIVAMVLLCIIAMVLVVQHGTLTPNWKSAYENALLESEAYKTQARMDRQIADREKDSKARMLTLRDLKDQQMVQKIGQLAAENTRLAAENAQHTSRLELMSAGLASLEASVAEQVQMNRVLTVQRDKQNVDLQQLHAQLRDTTLKAQEYARDLETARQSARVKSDLLARAEARISELEEKLAAGGMASRGETIPIPATEINGRVTEVSVEDGVAQLNVGAASGVRVNMRFYLYRGTTYVGDLIVAQVEPNNCAGILKNLQVQPLPQDRVTTDLTAE